MWHDLQGDNARFQVLNDREGRLDWYRLAQQDYGKFTNSTSPYHLWEVRSSQTAGGWTQAALDDACFRPSESALL